ncbi:hypothetical protein [Flavivirga jejuensis]|uniref:Thioredoxin domain-containing protein n=1 Tax=Flavivirga jejuensis TaxID=870487 RepID=A0ABT8WRA9_9FLAO|nr:hypothetical protein [Flavivirga jejuensis]MDO5975446.1 hypothetical protein [Flavivirga jejuensis]
MKKILSVLFIFITTFVCNAKNPIEPCNKVENINDNKIPEGIKKWLKSELSNTTTAVLENFESPAFYTKKKAKIIGYIKRYDKTLGAKTGIFYYTNQLTRENKPRVLEIHQDGRFELELPLEYPMQNYFVIEKQRISFYIEPGQNLSIILDWEDLKAKRTSLFLKKAIYQGTLENINTDLLHFQPKYSPRSIQKKQEEMEPIAYKQKMYQFKEHFLNKIKAYEESGEIDRKTSELLENQIILTAYRYIFDYFSVSKGIKLNRKGINIEDQIPEGYYDFIKELPLHKQSLLVNQDFGLFVNRLEYAPPLQALEKNRSISTGIATKDFLEFLENKNVTVSAEEKQLFDRIEKEKSNRINNIKLSKELTEKITKFRKKHEVLIKEYSQVSRIRMDNKRKKNFVQKWKKQDSLATNLGVKNNLIYEIIKSRTLKFIMETDGLYKDKAWYWSELKKDIKSPHLIKVGDDLFENEISKPEFYKLPYSEPGTAIFNKIIAPYKGKIVVVQFWNPNTYYKGESLERMKKRRDLYKNNKDIVFLNITNESRSSIEKYNTSVEKNGFINSIRMPNDDYNYIRQLFRFNASVHDVLVKKDGETVYNDLKSYNIESIFIKKFNINPDK